MSILISNGSVFLWVIRFLETVIPQIRAVGEKKWSGCQASKLHISDILMPECVYLSPNEYICIQMCIFMTKLIKFSGL